MFPQKNLARKVLNTSTIINYQTWAGQHFLKIHVLQEMMMLIVQTFNIQIRWILFYSHLDSNTVVPTNFAHDTAAVLSWHAQSFVVVWWQWMEWQQRVFHWIWSVMEKSSWNEPLALYICLFFIFLSPNNLLGSCLFAKNAPANNKILKNYICLQKILL